MVQLGVLDRKSGVVREVKAYGGQDWSSATSRDTLEVIIVPQSLQNLNCVPVSQSINREIITHAQLAHSSIIEFLGVYYGDGDLVPRIVLLPYMASGGVLDYFKGLPCDTAAAAREKIVRATSYYKFLLSPAMLTSNCVVAPKHATPLELTTYNVGGHLRFLAPEFAAGKVLEPLIE